MKSPLELGLPFKEWRPGQRLAIRTCLAPKTTHIVLNAPTGCVAGDTEIRVNRAHIGYRVAIQDEYANQSHFNRHNDIVTYVRALKDERVGLHSTQGVVYSGEKRVYRLRLQSGHTLRATHEHEILTDDGFAALGDLRYGMQVTIELPRRTDGPRKRKPSYKQIQGLRYHPFAGRWQSTRVAKRCLKPEGTLYRVPLHRVVVEADLNHLSVERFVDICRTDARRAALLTYLDPAVWAVHHKDEDVNNNRRSNLNVLTHEAHARVHGDERHFKDGRIGTSSVVTVQRQSYESTFDVVCDEPYRNFVANGIVIHNSGKSTIAAALPRLRPDKRHVTLTSTKGLQDQYGSTFVHLSDLRGLSNYECLAARDEFKDWFGVRRRHVTCDDGPCREGAHCALRDEGCLYFDRRRSFLASNAGVTNYAAWLSNRRYGEGLGQADVLVLDEAHNLPDELMSAARIDIPSHILNSRPPKTWRDWRRWASDKLTSLPKADEEDTRAGKARLEDSLRKLSGINETWAWDYTIDTFTFEPTIPKLLLPTLHTFDGECTIIYLSATITPATLIMLDVDSKDVTFETMESRFPLPMRPVYIRGRTRVDYHSMQNPAQHQAWIDEIDDIIGERLDRNGLIHTVSFDRGYDILKHSRYKRYMLMHHRGQNVGDVITDFRARGKSTPCILLSPSITTGYDFPGTQAEYQIIAKLPFPDTRSRIMKARCDNTSEYAQWATMTRLVQAAGRINRSAEDRGETFIVDGHARWFLDQYPYLAPKWFLDAIVTTRRVTKPLPKLRSVA